MSARKLDTNGWIEIKGNPISKAGVFQYHGTQLPRYLGLNQDKMYNVYRPKEELEKPEAINSFKLLPWTDDHPERLLGSANDGLVPAESKGVHGVTGEDIYVDGDFLKSNIKVFSQNLADQINSGKKDLSIGYKADYILQNGVYNGSVYDLVQTNLRGNHISLVDEGRSGREVSVLDKKDKGVFDMNEEKDMANLDEDQAEASVLTLEMLAGQMKELKEIVVSSLGKLMNMEASEAAEDENGDDYDSDMNEKEYIKSEIEEHEDDPMDEDEKEKKDEDDADARKDDYLEKEKGAMDAAAIKKSVLVEISKRNDLASRLSKHIGVFDSSEMTLSDVAKYGVKKLGLSCKKGFDSVMLEGYLAGKGAASASAARTAVAMDSSIKSSKIDQYLRGGK